MASDTLSNLIADAQLAEQRFVRGEVDLAALAPYDRALLAHVERLPTWDLPVSPVLVRARSREVDRESRPARLRKSYVPRERSRARPPAGAPDYDSPFRGLVSKHLRLLLQRRRVQRAICAPSHDQLQTAPAGRSER